MCGRYALALRPSQIRRMLEQEHMPVDDAPEDEGQGSPRQTYNFAPGYHGVVYRADVPDRGAGHRSEHKGDDEQDKTATTAGATASEPPREDGKIRYKMQSMQWGLIPFWTKRDPGYSTLSKTINCRDDSLSTPGGMWSTMKAGKRCIIVAQGFYEWLKNGKEKMPHFVKRKDGQLMCFAGLWDCVQYEDADFKRYTYTIITTDSNKQLKFLHDRMPVILNPGSKEIRTWLDPKRHEWSKELQDLLKPFDGELDCYPVSKEVGKVGNNSPSFIIPVASKENKSNIANFFANASAKQKPKEESRAEHVVETNVEVEHSKEDKKQPVPDIVAEAAADADGQVTKAGIKREAAESSLDEEPPRKLPSKTRQSRTSATSNGSKSPVKPRDGTQKITKFFANSV
ncbi:Putative SOS response associated peptidase (SRAP) [Colletotrichum destructivum]|uniref:SOS response associated peptidase (SRAP) n=1 Tax=Colletotrichum destructivum TaxID=34406 RepID=A0AAX4J0S5_9PEZI|nr:Putative SOS response associated peptidase (SRAP) [Colletotrichum destructivum]